MNFSASYPNLTFHLNNHNIVILDAGCAGGIHEIFSTLSQEHFTQAFGFEANKDEYEKVIKTPQQENIKFFNKALFDKDGVLDFHQRSTVGSVFRREDREEIYGETFETKSIPCAKITTLASTGTLPQIPDIIKLDVEGSEMAILNSLDKNLNNDVLAVFTEFGFHAAAGQNNFSEIHLKMLEAGFRLMDITYSALPMLGLMSGDALYIKRADYIIKEDNIKNKDTKLIKLAALSYFLRQNEICALISHVSDKILPDNIRKEIDTLSHQTYFFPSVLPFKCSKVSFVLFSLSQILSGQNITKKAIPKLNRIGRIKWFFTRTSIFRNQHIKRLKSLLNTYLIQSKHTKEL